VATNLNASWQVSSQNRQTYVAAFALAAATDTTFNLNIAQSVQGADHVVLPKYLTVDNINNNATITCLFGPFSFATPPYQRLTFSLPEGTPDIKVLVPSGSCSVVVAEEQVAEDTQSLLAISQTAVKTLIYGYVTYNVGPQTQQAGDQNSNVLFTPTIADMVYNLLPISTPIGNGWYQIVKNRGTKKVSITPSGGDLINSAYTSAAPLILNPGDSGVITSDGATWYFDGEVSFESADQTPVAAGSIMTIPHGLKTRPDDTSFYIALYCRVAASGWSIGDKININYGNMNAAGANGNISWVADATNIVLYHTGVLYITTKVTLVTLTLNSAADYTNFKLVAGCRKHW